jgi:Zn-dependent protease with chaperone function
MYQGERIYTVIMNFFAEQERARRASRRGVLWFTLGVIAVFLAVDLLVALVAQWTAGRLILPPAAHLGILLVILITVAIGVVYRRLELGSGGDAVAEMVGGRRIDADSRDFLERRLLNIVEEMAIASGISVPRVYLLDNEAGINAFAAGYSPNESVVAVTRGALAQLTREQLQGVIGHEFSHILNGDMGLNIRLLSWIGGLLGLFILGRFALRIAVRADDRKAAATFFALGIGLCIAGYAGMIFGQIMQAAVSRQREYLADASAVQFTRNPEGIGGALRRIAGYPPDTQLAHPNGETVSYMCFGAAVSNAMFGLFATHPPIKDRIAKIYGHAMPAILEEPVATDAAGKEDRPRSAAFAPATGGSALQPWLPETVVASAGQLAPEQVESAQRFLTELDPQLRSGLRNPTVAQDIVAACLLLVEPAQRQRQIALLQAELPPERCVVLPELIERVQACGAAQRMELVELALSALSALDAASRDCFIDRMRLLVLVDNSLCMQELLLLRVLEYRLLRQNTALRNQAPRPLSQLADAAAVLLSALAHASASRAAEAFLRGIPYLQGRCRNLTTPESVPALTVKMVSDGLGQLRSLAPEDKPLLLGAAVAIVTCDGHTSDDERLLLRALCACLDVPMPAAMRLPS